MSRLFGLHGVRAAVGVIFRLDAALLDDALPLILLAFMAPSLRSIVEDKAPEGKLQPPAIP